MGMRCTIGVAISVRGRTWGVMIATSKHVPLQAETEARLQGFTELLATAISNASAHDEVRILADEQAALRRVATLVAKQAPQGEVLATIAEEVGGLLAVDSVHMVRYEEDGVAAVVAGWGTLAQPRDIEVSAYFITNVVKHVRATRATVRAEADDGVLALEVHDDGSAGRSPTATA